MLNIGHPPVRPRDVLITDARTIDDILLRPTAPVGYVWTIDALGSASFQPSTGGGGGAVNSVFGRTGIVSAQLNDYTTTLVGEGTNLYYTEARVSANASVVANTAKVGITPTQITDIGLNNSHRADIANPHAVTATQSGAEATLGNPTVDGYVLSSTILGARSWVPPSSGGTIQGTGINTLNIRATDEGTVVGNPRGENSVDLQTIRSDASQVASGISSFLGGGGNNTISGNNASIVGGLSNRTLANLSFIGGGTANTVNSFWSSILGGQSNTITGTHSAILGGNANSITNSYALIAGGQGNLASGTHSSVLGGENHIANGSHSIVAGFNNRTPGDFSISFGSDNQSNGKYSVTLGAGNTAGSFGETVAGAFAVPRTGSLYTSVATDNAFVVGGGASQLLSKDVFRVLKNSSTMIGLAGTNAFVTGANDTGISFTNVDTVLNRLTFDSAVAGVVTSHYIPIDGTGAGVTDHTLLTNIGINTHAQIDTFITSKGAANGLVPLNASSLIDSLYLPAYVDDVLEYANLAGFPATGLAGKIYVALDTNLTYRWSGTVYVEISASLALGITASTAYRGDYGNTAYQHSLATGNPHGVVTTDIVEGTNLYYTDARVSANTSVVANTSKVGISTQQANDIVANNAFRATPSTAIIAGANLSWVGNTLNAVAGAGVTDHTLLTNIGINTHAQIDTHIADNTIHYTQANISIPSTQISDFSLAVTNHADVSANTANKHASSLLGTKTLDETAIADTKVIGYNAISGNLEYVANIGGGGATIDDVAWIGGNWLSTANGKSETQIQNALKEVGINYNDRTSSLVVGDTNSIVEAYYNASGTAFNDILLDSYTWDAGYNFESDGSDIFGNTNLPPVGTPLYQAGKDGNALVLNGANNYLSTNAITNIAPTGNLVVSLWVKFNALNSNSTEAMFSFVDGVNNYKVALRVTNFAASNGMIITLTQSNGTIVNTPFEASDFLTNGVWTHVCAIADANNGTVNLYRDNVLIGQVAYDGTIDTTLTDFLIGSTDGLQKLNGYIDGFYYSKSIAFANPSERTNLVNQLYNAGAGRFITSSIIQKYQLSTAKTTDIIANNAKVSNVPTTLSAGTITGTSYGITSDGGVDDIVLPEANTTQAGLLSATKWNDIISNNAHRADVTTNPHGVTAVQTGAETALGNPSSNGYVLSSTIAGARSWVPQATGGSGGVSVTTATVSTTVTLTETSDTRQILNPIANVSVVLPATPTKDLEFVITNNAVYNSSFSLSVNVSGLTTYPVLIYAGATVRFVFDSATSQWKADADSWVMLLSNTLTNTYQKFNTSNGFNANGSDYGVANGYLANGSTNGVATGANTNGSLQGVANGYNANGNNKGVANGYNANGSNNGVANGYLANGSSYGVANGYNTNGNTYGVANGYQANGSNYGVATGYAANGSNNGVANGAFSIATKQYGSATGYYSKQERLGGHARSGDHLATSKAHMEEVFWTGTTANNFPTDLFLHGVANSRCTIKLNSMCNFKIEVSAIDTANIANHYTAEMTGTITNIAGVLTLSTVTTNIKVNTLAISVNLWGDNVNSSLNVTVTGIAATNIRYGIKGDLIDLVV